MPLQILDKNDVQRLEISESGLVSLGSGDPVAQITVDGVSVFNDQGQIINQRLISQSITPLFGAVTVVADAANSTNTSTIWTPETGNRAPLVSMNSDMGAESFSEDPDTNQLIYQQFPNVPQVTLLDVGVTFNSSLGRNCGYFTLKNMAQITFMVHHSNTVSYNANYTYI